MLIDVVEARPLEPYRLHLRFADGVEGVVDLERIVTFRGVFEPLREPDRFRELAVNLELGTSVWPNGADLDPYVLYAMVTGEAIRPVSPNTGCLISSSPGTTTPQSRSLSDGSGSCTPFSLAPKG